MGLSGVGFWNQRSCGPFQRRGRSTQPEQRYFAKVDGTTGRFGFLWISLELLVGMTHWGIAQMNAIVGSFAFLWHNAHAIDLWCAVTVCSESEAAGIGVF